MWPFRPWVSLLSAVALLLGLLLLVAGLRTSLNWPSEQSENVVVFGVFLLALLPVFLALLDLFIERGAVIEYRGVKLDFSQNREVGTAGLTVTPNIGVPDQPLDNSSIGAILGALKRATASDLVIIDLEKGQAWWETRLLVLLSGAERLMQSGKIVFVGTDARLEMSFRGWSYVKDLLPPLVQANAQYARSLQASRAAARQWDLVEPVNPWSPPLGPIPPRPNWISGVLANRQDMAAWPFDQTTGLRNDLFAEQLLALDLAEKIEQQAGSRGVGIVRLEELFGPVLYKECVDVTWPSNRQLAALLGSEAPFVAITQDGRYLRLASRLGLFNEVLKSIVDDSRRP